MIWTSFSVSRPAFRCSWRGVCSARASPKPSRPTSACARSIWARTRMAELLRVEDLSAGYGEARVISNLDLRLEDGESLALLGRNGVGKTTLINSLIGV